MLPRLLSLVIGLAFASAVWAFDDWPQWRGPNRDGHSAEKGLLDKWEESPELVWKANGCGKGYAGAVVDNGIVCTIGQAGDTVYVIAVSDKDGAEIWRTEIPDDKSDRGSHFEPKSTPIIDGERLYALTRNGVLVCLETATGKQVWKRSYQHDFGGEPPISGFAESPLIDGDKLICSPTGPQAGIVALDKKTGEELWRCALSFDKKGFQRSGYASPVISHGAGIKQYVQFVGWGLVGIDAQTGKQLWSNQRTSGGSNVCTPIIHGDYVFAPCGFYVGSVLLKLVPTGDGGVETQEVYFLKIADLETVSGGAVLVGEYVYFSHAKTGAPQCMELLTGKMMWDPEDSPSGGSASVIYADGHIYVRYEGGTVALVAATPNAYQLKGKFKTPRSSDHCWAHPAISNGRLYLRNGNSIYCYDLKK